MASQPSTDIEITDLRIDLEPGNEKYPVAPLVQGMTIRISDAALDMAMRTLIAQSKGKTPVEVEFESARFVPGGAEVTISAGSGRFLRAKVAANVAITADGSDKVAASVAEVRALGKLPIEGIIGPMLDKALDKACQIPGVARDPLHPRGVLIAPNELLAHFGVPLRFAEGGGWAVSYGDGWLEAVFAQS